nr:MAG TPA: hypothetical protein [Caudoviricetes sp.]
MFVTYIKIEAERKRTGAGGTSILKQIVITQYQ